MKENTNPLQVYLRFWVDLSGNTKETQQAQSRKSTGKSRIDEKYLQ
jgi:hypothetical protein